MQEIMMHRVRFVHGGTSIHPYNRSHTLIPFVKSSQRFLMYIKFVSPSGFSDEKSRVRGRVLIAQEHQPLPAKPRLARFRASGSPRATTILV
jgi:hypothetical protein